MREKALLLPLSGLFCEFDIMWHKNSVVLGFDFDFLYSRQLLCGASSSVELPNQSSYCCMRQSRGEEVNEVLK